MPPEDVFTSLNSFFIAISLLLGLLVGSFCNVCVGRWPHGESVVSPRSRCPKCMNAISWFDNIPLLSWLILGAKCRHCKAPISWQYPLVEAITGVLFVIVYLRFGMTIASPVYMLLAAAMVVVTFQDLTDWTIPDEISLTGLPIGLALSVVAMFLPEGSELLVTHPFEALKGMALGFGVLYGLDRLTVLILKRPGMGLGDVKLLAMLGGFIGWQGVLGTLMLASVIGSTVGITVKLYFRSKAAPKTDEATPDNAETVASTENAPSEAKQPNDTGEDDEEDDDGIALSEGYLPFGPYLAFAGLVYALIGPRMLEWYLASLVPAGY